MVDWKVYGLGTDEHIKKYCSDREIPCADIEKKIVDAKIIPFDNLFSPELVVLNTKDLCAIVDDACKDMSVSKRNKNLFIIGSGAFHHMTYALLYRQRENDISLVNMDAHCDRSPMFPIEHVSCGSHVHEALRNGLVQNYFHIEQWKSSDKSKPETHPKIYHTLNDHDKYPTKEITPKELASCIAKRFYLTIDIDVLSERYVTIDKKWSGPAQGNMSIGTLLKIVRELPLQNALGVDICGMCKDKRSEHVYDSLLQLIRN
ncbi:MAG: arginase family protein [Candidatus Woesearchaeota archaeon]